VTVSLARVDWFDPRAVVLRAAMDAETSAMYAEFTSGTTPEVRAAIDAVLTVDPAAIEVAVLAVEDDRAVGHAALRPYHDEQGEFGDELEVKKVFVDPEARGTGASRALMTWLEEYAVSKGIGSLVLQTGPLQIAAIALYEKLGYRAIEPYGGYGVIPGALCYRKVL
jgi:GNAT superfamily N-acetyltransferase